MGSNVLIFEKNLKDRVGVRTGNSEKIGSNVLIFGKNLKDRVGVLIINFEHIPCTKILCVGVD